MKKEEYLKALENRLKKTVPTEEVAEIIADYDEYFEDGRRQGKSDEEISAKLGTPEFIAEQFLEEEGSFQTKRQKSREKLRELKQKAQEEWDSLKDKIPNVETEPIKNAAKKAGTATEGIFYLAVKVGLWCILLLGLGCFLFFAALVILSGFFCGGTAMAAGIGGLVLSAITLGPLGIAAGLFVLFCSIFLLAGGFALVVLMVMAVRLVISVTVGIVKRFAGWQKGKTEEA